ncbi:adenylate/guanylate cyclase domain-containing protein [Hoeflea sp.]|uniref:adenylate/guanylate cyclase domain-containing protein n=1 Tax=Hoeflea sp. TaxID=1940281 RepID=UPI003B51FA9A
MYEREAAVKHRVLISTLTGRDRDAWSSLVAGRQVDPETLAAFRGEMRGEANEMGFDCAAIRSEKGRIIVASNGAGCDGSAYDLLTPTAEVGDSVFLEVQENGPRWLVVSRIADPVTGLPVIVISRHDAATQENLIGTNAFIWLAVLGGLFALIIICSIWLVGRAQSEIVIRTTALNDARRSLARFVSRHGQARAATGDGRARRLTATVLFLDIRDFSSFAESVSSEEAAKLVEAVAAIAFARILAAGGDVDRLLGDGLVAWFEGADRKERAWRAIAEILPQIENARLPRSVGAGLHDGELVEATIGAGERLDQTVLGRTVNISARLCSAAGVGEVLASEEMGELPVGIRVARQSRESLSLKGLVRPVRCMRMVGLEHFRAAS